MNYFSDTTLKSFYTAKKFLAPIICSLVDSQIRLPIFSWSYVAYNAMKDNRGLASADNEMLYNTFVAVVITQLLSFKEIDRIEKLADNITEKLCRISQMIEDAI